MFFLLLIALALALAAFYVRRQYTYWQRRGFPYDADASIPFGCLTSVAKREKSMGMAVYDLYLKTREPFIGTYLLFRPAVLVCDVEMVRDVLAKDFASFHDRGIYVDEERNPLSANLFAMRGKSWRSMRQKLAPSFTSGKLKNMFATIDDIGDKMVAHMNTVLPAQGSIEIDLKEICTTYAVDIIGSVIFGLDINSFENPKNKFRLLVNLARRNNIFSAFFSMFVFLCPSVFSIFVRLGLNNPVGLQMLDIIKETITHREKHNIVRKDMLQLMMQLRNTGEISADDNNWEAKVKAGGVKAMSLEAIAAQAFIFYIAGQETTAAAASFTIFELAQYPELLQRAQQEVNAALEQTGGKLTYELVHGLEFLERCMLETIRKYPGLPMLNRECTQTYQIPGTDKVIEKGTPIVISLFGMHRDPANFPDPNAYDPDRFLPTNHNFNANAFFPFGEGPRHCIAQRMGKMDAKLAVIKILQNFNVELMSRREIEIDNHSIAIIPKGGVKVRLSKKTRT